MYSCLHSYRCATVRCGAVVAFTLGLALLTSSRATAARYDTWEAPLSDAEGTKAMLDATKVLRNSTSLGDADKNLLNKAFAGHFFPSMTRTDAESLAELAKKRKDLFQQYLNRSGVAAPVRDYLIDLTIKAAGKIAFGNYHPAARYNAVLIIGSIDDKFQRNEPPVVSPKATQALLYLVEKEERDGTPIPTAIKIAALVGLQRHARFGVEPSLAEQLTAAALAVVNREERPEDVGSSVFNWMRVQAAEVLAYQFAEGPPPEVATALAKLIADKDMSLAERCRTAGLLHEDRMKLPADGAAANVLAPALATLARDLFDDEGDAAKEFEDEMLRDFGGNIGPGGGGFRGGGYGGGEFGGEMGGGRFGGGFDPNQDTGPRYEKRRMLARVFAVLSGLELVEATAEGDLKPKVSALIAPLQGLKDRAGEKNVTDIALARAVTQAARDVKLAAAQFNASAENDAEDDADAEADAFETAASE